MASVGELRVKIGADLREFHAGINQVSRSIKEFQAQSVGAITSLRGAAKDGATAWTWQQSAAHRVGEQIRNQTQHVKLSDATDEPRCELP